MAENPKEMKIQIRAPDGVLSGTYANNLLVHMNREEFVLDFVNIVPPHATLNARVTISPGNLKRMLAAIQSSLEKYEREFGPLPAPSEGAPPAVLVQ